MSSISCAFFYFSEEKTRKENLERIMDRLQERKVEVLGANREERRQKERVNKKEKKGKPSQMKGKGGEIVCWDNRRSNDVIGTDRMKILRMRKW
eukprot:644709-Hanusia_phi.AAC.1